MKEILHLKKKKQEKPPGFILTRLANDATSIPNE